MSLQSHHHHHQQQEQSRDSYCFSLSPGEEEDDIEAQAVLCLVEVEEQSRDRGCLDSNVSVDDCIKVELETDDEDYSHCIVLDIVPESCSETPGCKDEHHGSNGDGLLANMQKVFQRQASLKTEKPPTSEKSRDSLNNKWRKYKRAASFNSRKIAFLFSVLSSLGTLVLIYLTLSVKLHGDRYEHTS